MFKLPPLQADIQADIFRVLRTVKRFLADKLEDVPYVGGLIDGLPEWAVGVGVVILGLVVLFSALSLLSTFTSKLGASIRDTKIGEVKEKKKLLSQAARMARSKNYSQAAELYISAKEHGLAAEVLEKGELYGKAGQLYEGMGSLDKAIELYTKAGENNWLAEALQKKGDHSRAAEIYLKAGKKLLAAEGFKKAGVHLMAAQLFEEAGHTVEAARLYEKGGEFGKSALQYERAYVELASAQEAQTPERTGRLSEYSIKAGTYFEKTGKFEKAVEAFSRSKSYDKAGEAALKAGNRAKAAECFAMAKMYERAAEIYREDGNTARSCEVMADKYMDEGDISQAARMYMEAEDFIKAAEVFDQAGEYAMAGEALMKEREFSAAAEMFIKGGQNEKAADAYKAADKPKQAADIYLMLGQKDKASELVEESGDYMLAAELYRKLDQPEKELSALQKVDADDPRYHSAVIMLADFFKGQGKLRLAAEKYAQAIGGAEADQSNIELYYGLGTIYESDGRYEDASGIYEKIQLVDFRYKDVDARMKECAEKAAARNERQAASGEAVGTAGTAQDAARRYSILKEVGRGGMGIVYKARDNKLNRLVAVKLLPKSISDKPKIIRRFEAEARSAAQLTHNNIVTLYDFEQAAGRSFITMEYVEGFTLKKLIEMGKKLSIVNVLKIIYQCCQGLEYAHRKGVIHRDIKPGNIMVNRENIVKIMDFGLAKMAGEESLTEVGTISGTINYMSPEQLLGNKVDKTTDIYALGLLFYELITGSHPFAKGDAAYHQVNTKPEPPESLRPEVPENLSRIIMRCLEKDPARRFESALQLAQAMREMPLK